MFYRVAIRMDRVSPWQWRSTPLSSLQGVFGFLRLYQALPADRVRVFSSATREELQRQLAQANVELERPLVRSITAKLGQEILEPAGHRDAGTAARALSQGNQGAEVGQGLLSTASMSALDKQRFAYEMGQGGDHDVPYLFSLPLAVPQVLAWLELSVRVQNGELEP